MQPVIHRDEFIGANVTPEVKERVVREAQTEGVSVSRFIYQVLCARYGIKLHWER